MKAKLLYLIPVVLIGLNLTSFSLYKDTVGLSGKPPVLESLAPSHWKLLELNLSYSGGLVTTSSSDTATKSTSVLTNGATYKGFPFAAYFVNSQSSSTANSQSSYSASAWSWLWATVDGLIFVLGFVFAGKLNRRTVVQRAITAPLPAPVSAPVTDVQPAVPVQPVATPQQPAPASFYSPQIITPQAAPLPGEPTPPEVQDQPNFPAAPTHP